MLEAFYSLALPFWIWGGLLLAAASLCLLGWLGRFADWYSRGPTSLFLSTLALVPAGMTFLASIVIDGAWPMAVFVVANPLMFLLTCLALCMKPGSDDRNVTRWARGLVAFCVLTSWAHAARVLSGV